MISNLDCFRCRDLAMEEFGRFKIQHVHVPRFHLESGEMLQLLCVLQETTGDETTPFISWTGLNWIRVPLFFLGPITGKKNQRLRSWASIEMESDVRLPSRTTHGSSFVYSWKGVFFFLEVPMALLWSCWYMWWWRVPLGFLYWQLGWLLQCQWQLSSLRSQFQTKIKRN